MQGARPFCLLQTAFQQKIAWAIPGQPSSEFVRARRGQQKHVWSLEHRLCGAGVYHENRLDGHAGQRDHGCGLADLVCSAGLGSEVNGIGLGSGPFWRIDSHHRGGHGERRCLCESLYRDIEPVRFLGESCT